MHKVSNATCIAIVLNYNGWQATLACLYSLNSQQEKLRRIIVVDNASRDESVLNILKHWPTVQRPIVISESGMNDISSIIEKDSIIYALSSNCGYASGNNKGIQLALQDKECTAVWILNNDTEFGPHALKYLCDTLNSDPKAGIAGSTQVYAGTDLVQCAGGASVNRWLGSTKSLKEACTLHDVLQCDPQHLNPLIDFTAGASMLVRREVFEKIGLIPEEYFLYYEDVDYGVSAKKAGFNLVWARDSIVYHHDGSSSKQQGVAPAWIDFLILRNRLYFIKKHYKKSVPVAILGYAGVVLNRIRRGQVDRLENIFLAITDALAEKMGMSDRAIEIARTDTLLCQKLSENINLTFSLIVATWNRLTSLEKLLQSLSNQTYRQFEIIIVDQNQKGFLDNLLKGFLDLNIKVVHVPSRGVSRARNMGILHSTGDIVAFPDDDCWYDPATLAKVHDILCSRKHIAGLLVAWSEAEKKPTKPSITRVNRINAFFCGETYVQFYRKDAVKGIIFDQELGPGTDLPYGCGEDTDFLLQVLARNQPLVRTTEVLVYHPRPNLADQALLKKTAAYACGRMRLLQKHNFPLWFKIANVVFPLVKAVHEGRRAWPYRWVMFCGRLKGLLKIYRP